MKILIDQNISYRIVDKITFLGVVQHIKSLGLTNANDHKIFMYARQGEFDVIVTIDDDFTKLLQLFSTPPKIIWIRTGNCSTEFLAELLLQKKELIQAFIQNHELECYEIFK
jgi:predicted nuclease of predicted toxin-antitoxin system